MNKKPKIHYTGGIVWENGNMLPGWACCCSGEKCYVIRDKGNTSNMPIDITCGACKKKLEAQLKFAEKGHAAYIISWLREMRGFVPGYLQKLADFQRD